MIHHEQTAHAYRSEKKDSQESDDYGPSSKVESFWFDLVQGNGTAKCEECRQGCDDCDPKSPIILLDYICGLIKMRIS